MTTNERGTRVQTEGGLGDWELPKRGELAGRYEAGEPVVYWDDGTVGTWPEDELKVEQS